jgi:hypothetical protein
MQSLGTAAQGMQWTDAKAPARACWARRPQAGVGERQSHSPPTCSSPSNAPVVVLRPLVPTSPTAARHHRVERRSPLLSTPAHKAGAHALMEPHLPHQKRPFIGISAKPVRSSPAWLTYRGLSEAGRYVLRRALILHSGAGCGGACSRGSNSMPWRAMFIMASAGTPTDAISSSR